MLYRLVRPIKRKESSNPQFVKRIPLDLRNRMSGMKLCLPLGDDTVSVAVSAKTQAIRFSLRSSDPGEVKDRQATAVSYLERLFSRGSCDIAFALEPNSNLDFGLFL
ncbi:MAG: hypothetical protein NXH99_02085 [Rhodobacteraceae bacterium]|nr:hypothetical protein [Paracoccaceae bacterium]